MKFKMSPSTYASGADLIEQYHLEHAQLRGAPPPIILLMLFSV